MGPFLSTYTKLSHPKSFIICFLRKTLVFLYLYAFLWFSTVVTIFNILSSVKRQNNSWYFKRFYSLQRRSTVIQTHMSAECDEEGGRFSTLYSHTQGYRVTIVQLYFSSLGEEANSILLNHVVQPYSLYI